MSLTFYRPVIASYFQLNSVRSTAGKLFNPSMPVNNQANMKYGRIRKRIQLWVVLRLVPCEALNTVSLLDLVRLTSTLNASTLSMKMESIVVLRSNVFWLPLYFYRATSLSIFDFCSVSSVFISSWLQVIFKQQENLINNWASSLVAISCFS